MLHRIRLKFLYVCGSVSIFLLINFKIFSTVACNKQKIILKHILSNFKLKKQIHKKRDCNKEKLYPVSDFFSKVSSIFGFIKPYNIDPIITRIPIIITDHMRIGFIKINSKHLFSQ